MNRLQFSLSRRAIFFTFIAIVIAGTTAAAGFYYIQYTKAQNIIKNSNMSGQLEAADLAKKVSRFILLPEGEVPQIATVSDYKKLKDQPFFEKSKNGDKVLIYTKAQKAYLYRPSTDKLIDVTVVNIDSPSPKPKEIKIVLRNGTQSVGLTNKLEPEIKKGLPNSKVVKKENAAKSDYETTVVVALNENVKGEAITLADYLNASASGLPLDESKPEGADILVIIGKDNVL